MGVIVELADRQSVGGMVLGSAVGLVAGELVGLVSVESVDEQNSAYFYRTVFGSRCE